MIRGLLALVLCQLAGDFVAHALALPVPGPVLGMALLLAVLLVRAGGRRRTATRPADATSASSRPAEATRSAPLAPAAPAGVPSGIGAAADGLIRHLQLIFVPAGAGIVLYLPELARSWSSVVGGIVLGWLATLLASAGGAAAVLRWQARRSRRDGPGGVGAAGSAA